MNTVLARLERLERLERIERLKTIDHSELSENELNEKNYYLLVNEIRLIKNVANFYGIEIEDKESFMKGLRVYADKCFPESKRDEFYNDETILRFGEYFDEFKERLLKSI